MKKKTLIDEYWVIVDWVSREKGIVAVSPYDPKTHMLTSGLTLITSITDKKIKIVGDVSHIYGRTSNRAETGS
jgi:hypothetical protein